ncbi:MAG: LysE family translocator [Gammaproteobacteria bacterium]|nr:MAG: LysE family translocator [Gammaproteobacteria bacterium]
MSDAQIYLYIVTSLVIILTPGQDLVLVLSRGITLGSKGGVVTAAGVSAGLVGHTILTSVGLGALLMASDLIFSIIRYIGAAYLIYLGFKLLTSKDQKLELHNSGRIVSSKDLFTSGALSNISNPKVTIFYFAYLPQFISTDVSNPTTYLFTLGITFALLTLIVKVPIGYLAGKFSKFLRQRPTVLKWLDRTSGTILVALGIKLALEQKT